MKLVAPGLRDDIEDSPESAAVLRSSRTTLRSIAGAEPGGRPGGPAIRLTKANVARTVPPNRAGVFFLKSVGRDDVDVRKRLLQYARKGGENALFGWMLAENPHDAYRLECYLWHAQGGAWARIEGDAHPTPAERIPFLGCPDCEE